MKEDTKVAEMVLIAEPDFAIIIDTAGNSKKCTERTDGETLMLQ